MPKRWTKRKIMFSMMILFITSTISLFIFFKSEENESDQKSVSPFARETMTLSEKRTIASGLMAKFREYNRYFLENSFYDLTISSCDQTDYHSDDIYEYVYNVTKLYDCYVGLNGVFSDIIPPQDLDKYGNVNADWFFSDRILYGYTGTGAHIIAILPIESNEDSIWCDAMNQIRNDPEERDVLSPNYGIVDIFVEDLAGKAKEYSISVKVKGFAAYSDVKVESSISSDIRYFPCKVSIPDDVEDFVSSFKREINEKQIIRENTWKLFVIDKGNYDLFWSSGIEVTLDGEAVTLQPIESS